MHELNKKRKESREFINALFKISTKHFKISPKDFWQLTIFEYNQLYNAYFGEYENQALDRKGLNALMEKYPD